MTRVVYDTRRVWYVGPKPLYGFQLRATSDGGTDYPAQIRKVAHTGGITAVLDEAAWDGSDVDDDDDDDDTLSTLPTVALEACVPAFLEHAYAITCADLSSDTMRRFLQTHPNTEAVADGPFPKKPCPCFPRSMSRMGARNFQCAGPVESRPQPGKGRLQLWFKGFLPGPLIIG
jgi:hypothetical protein